MVKPPKMSYIAAAAVEYLLADDRKNADLQPQSRGAK